MNSERLTEADICERLVTVLGCPRLARDNRD